MKLFIMCLWFFTGGNPSKAQLVSFTNSSETTQFYSIKDGENTFYNLTLRQAIERIDIIIARNNQK